MNHGNSVVENFDVNEDLRPGETSSSHLCVSPINPLSTVPFSKQVFDFVIALFLFVIVSPTFILITLMVALEGGPIFFAHSRIGVGGRSFKCLKFRTMVPDADRVLAATLATDPQARQEWDTRRKLPGDPRITTTGRFLRKTSLDELPQLLNVLRGEMSLVGPRPIVYEEAEKYGDDFQYYVAVKPGITGLWQISGRSDTTFAQRVAFDKQYVRNWCLRFDLLILAKTVPALLARRGAY